MKVKGHPQNSAFIYVTDKYGLLSCIHKRKRWEEKKRVLNLICEYVIVI